jgi:hypothetical protein
MTKTLGSRKCGDCIYFSRYPINENIGACSFLEVTLWPLPIVEQKEQCIFKNQQETREEAYGDNSLN